MKSLYAQYVAEREGAEVLEGAWGFAAYKFEVDHVYISDIYIVPEQRNKGASMQAFSEITGLAKQKGLKYVFGSVAPSTKTATANIGILLKLGFKLHSASDDIIYLNREI